MHLCTFVILHFCPSLILPITKQLHFLLVNHVKLIRILSSKVIQSYTSWCHKSLWRWHNWMEPGKDMITRACHWSIHGHLTEILCSERSVQGHVTHILSSDWFSPGRTGTSSTIRRTGGEETSRRLERSGVFKLFCCHWFGSGADLIYTCSKRVLETLCTYEGYIYKRVLWTPCICKGKLSKGVKAFDLNFANLKLLTYWQSFIQHFQLKVLCWSWNFSSCCCSTVVGCCNIDIGCTFSFIIVSQQTVWFRGTVLAIVIILDFRK